jgi:chemotaxis protein CheX
MTETKSQELISPADIIAAIKSSTEEVFSTMLNLGVTTGVPSVEKEVATDPTTGVVALVGLAGSWIGTGSLSCSVQFACKMSGQFLMAEFDSMNEEVLDSVAEIANMVVGNVKTVLEEKAGRMGLSTPTVILGHNLQTHSAHSHEWTVVPFTCGEERLFVQMCLARNKDSVKTPWPGFSIPQDMNPIRPLAE